MAGEFDFLEGIGISTSDVEQPATVYQKFMQGKASIQEFLKSLN